MEKQSYKPSILKVGNRLMFGPVNSMKAEFAPNTMYKIQYNSNEGSICFDEIGDVELPKKLYITDKDSKFIDKVLNRYNTVETGVVGVMLDGVKGAGKTVTVKKIAKDSNLPIFTLDAYFPYYKLTDLFDKISDLEICIIIDELDKFSEHYDTNKLLDCLDGMTKSGKKLILMTCNEIEKTNKYLQDRCSRIRYSRTYSALDKDTIKLLAKDRLENKDNVDKFTKFVSDRFKLPSFDNVNSFISEVNDYKDEDYESLIADMNINVKKK